jgi:hypothetical protein
MGVVGESKARSAEVAHAGVKKKLTIGGVDAGSIGVAHANGRADGGCGWDGREYTLSAELLSRARWCLALPGGFEAASCVGERARRLPRIRIKYDDHGGCDSGKGYEGWQVRRHESTHGQCGFKGMCGGHKGVSAGDGMKWHR